MLSARTNEGRTKPAMWLNNNGKSSGLLPGRESVGPLALMCITPVFIFILWFTMQHLGGDFGKLIENFQAVSQTGGAGGTNHSASYATRHSRGFPCTFTTHRTAGAISR